MTKISRHGTFRANGAAVAAENIELTQHKKLFSDIPLTEEHLFV